MDEKIDINRLAGQRIRTMRKILGISQSELGSRINVTFQQIQKYEKGINRLSIGTFMEICEVLQVSAVDMLQDMSGKPDLTLFTKLVLGVDKNEKSPLGKKSDEKFRFLHQLALLEDSAIRDSILKLIEAVSKDEKAKAAG